MTNKKGGCAPSVGVCNHLYKPKKVPHDLWGTFIFELIEINFNFYVSHADVLKTSGILEDVLYNFG